MKFKIAIIASLLFAVSTSFAQETYKQESGDQSFEVEFNPGSFFGNGDNTQIGFLNGGVKYRQFTSEDSAFRVGFNVTYNNNIDVIQQENDDLDLLELKERDSYMFISFMGGIENHFEGTNRFSPYVGYQGTLGFSRSSSNMEVQDGNSTYLLKNTNEFGNDGFHVGIGILTGFDYYIAEDLFLGVELAYGVGYTKKSKTTFEDEDDHDHDLELANGSAFGISPSLTTANLRLGWLF